jgi:hypothetical protein
MALRRLAALLLALLPLAPGAAQQVVTSPGPDAVAVTVYRAPGRGLTEEMELDWLDGYALITETRTIFLPAGESVVRFEGVSGNILPVSVVVSGLPRSLSERNYDARLLSPGALVDASLGRQVHIRRTSRATGKVTETEAIIRSGPNGIVLQTSEGFEALRCTGLPETLVYREAPADLSDKPTLAVRTGADAPVTATVRLSYLSGQFDWQANYVAQLGADGRTLDLFAWLTLANANDESFLAAQTQTVAGTVNREEDGDDGRMGPVSPEVEPNCWAAGNTGDPAYELTAPAPPPGAMEAYDMYGEEIVVTGSRISRPNLQSAIPITAMTAEQEELGDLKLYRIPEPVTVAANAQKQVALLSKPRVPFKRVAALTLQAASDHEDPQPIPKLLRLKNLKKEGLGVPLPGGSVAIFENVEGRTMLVRETPLEENAVGQDLEIEAGESEELTFLQRQIPLARGKDGEVPDEEGDYDAPRRRFEIELRNAGPEPAEVEVLLWTRLEHKLRKPSRKLGHKNGGRLWTATVPANGSLRFDYVIERRPEPPKNIRVDEEEEEEVD